MMLTGCESGFLFTLHLHLHYIFRSSLLYYRLYEISSTKQQGLEIKQEGTKEIGEILNMMETVDLKWPIENKLPKIKEEKIDKDEEHRYCCLF